MANRELGIQLGTEHDVPDFCNVHRAKKAPSIVKYRNEHGLAAAQDIYELAQRHVGSYAEVVFLYDAVHAHQCQRSLVSMVSDELALPCQSHGVDAVRLEDTHHHHGHRGDYNQRHKQGIATCNFCYKKYACERGVHDSCHDSSHTKKGEVLFRNIYSNLLYVPYSCKEKAAKSTYKQ